MLKPVTYTLPAYWASYLINGDASGIDEKEKAQADAFLKRNNLPMPVDCGEEEFARSNDAGTLAGDVCEYTFLIPMTDEEESEEITNDLIAVIWPLLDRGKSKSDVMGFIHNVLDAWEPKGKE